PRGGPDPPAPRRGRPPARGPRGPRPGGPAGRGQAARTGAPRSRGGDPGAVSTLFDALPVGALGLLSTALVLGIRHGFDWDHLAAITDVTSTTATADVAELDHEAVHERTHEHHHGHGGPAELEAHLPGR